MRIALVTETYPPEINGVALTLERLARGLRQRGWDVSVVRPRRADRNPLGADLDVDVVGMPIPGYPQLRLGLPAPLLLRRLWGRQRPDIVHVATEGPLGASAVWVARRLGIPVVSSYHTNFHAYSGHYGLGPLRPAMLGWLRFLHNRTRRTFAPTRALCRELESLGFRDLAVLSRGVDTHNFSPERRNDELRAAWGAAPDSVVALHVGRVAAEKNLGLLFEAYAAMRVAQPRLLLVVVGDGPLRAELEKRHPEVRFTGFVSRSNLGAHYASADLFVLPSVTETFGNVLTEALASGLPTVSYDYAAASEFVRSGINGLTVPLGNRAGFIEAATHLATDANLRRRLAAEARGAVSQQSWDRIIGEFSQSLSAIATSAPRGADSP